MCIIQAPNDQNTAIVQSILLNSYILRRISRCVSSTLNSLLWSGLDFIINALDPMQNPGQTWFFYTLGLDPLDMDKTWPRWANLVLTLLQYQYLSFQLQDTAKLKSYWPCLSVALYNITCTKENNVMNKLLIKISFLHDS